MAWPKGKKRGPVEQGNAADVQADDHAPESDIPAADAPAGLDEFAAWAQRLKLPVVLVALSHPDADERHMDGTFGGYAQSPGPVGAKWSDGSAYP